MQSLQFCTKIVTLFWFAISLKLYGRTEAKALCGFPGTPAFGYVKPDANLYSEGDVVTYTCRVGYILLGAPIRRCKDDGTWTEEIPICDDSMTTLGFAFSTPAVPGHPAEMAIDRDKDTCTYLQPKKTRWWRIDLGHDYKVLSVAVTMADTDKYTKFTVFVIKIQGTSASYKRCASFSGKFGTPTVVLSCAEGKGIEGQRVHIEDHLQTEDIFEVCEVEVQVEKDTGYECGKPDRNPYSIIYDIKGDQAEYGCLTGYELEGREYRTCLSTGQWLGEPPSCKAIVCEPLPPLENGELQLSVVSGEIPLEGTVANFNCDEGYKLLGDFNRICLKDGSWSGKQPQCEAVRCPVPDGRELGGVYRLVNKTTRMGSMALLKCRKGKMDGTNPYIICTEEGDWTEPQSRCLIPARAATAMTEGPRIAKKDALIFGMVVAGIMMTIVFVSLYVVTQKRRRASKPALPSRQIESLEAPPRPPPRTKGALASTLLECVTGSTGKLYAYEPANKENEALLKTRSLPLKNSENKEEWKAEVTPNKAISLDQPFHEDVNEERPKSTSPKSQEQPETSGGEEPAPSSPTESEAQEAPEETEIKKEEAKADTKPTDAAGREYAAVDYEKKRQSRLQKGRSSEESEESRQSRPTSPQEKEKETTPPPTVPPKESTSTDEAKEAAEPEKAEEKSDESSGRRRARGRQTEAEESEADKEARKPRRTRAPAETPPEPEDKPTVRGARRTRVRE